MNEIIPKRPYRHFKGNLYYVHDILTDSETGEKIVSYQCLYEPFGMFARSLEMFLEEVEQGRADNVTNQKYRFELYLGNK